VHAASRCCVDVVEVVVRVRCAGCADVVYFCGLDYRGQIYCSVPCQRAADRETEARHQRSRRGRFDHAARNVDYRARQHALMKPAKIVTDTRSRKLAAETMSCASDDTSVSVVEEHAVVAEGTDDGTNHSDDAASAARDAAPRDGGKGRGDAPQGCCGHHHVDDRVRDGPRSREVLEAAASPDRKMTPRDLLAEIDRQLVGLSDLTMARVNESSVTRFRQAWTARRSSREGFGGRRQRSTFCSMRRSRSPR
jgi:hypothetical protein